MPLFVTHYVSKYSTGHVQYVPADGVPQGSNPDSHRLCLLFLCHHFPLVGTSTTHACAFDRALQLSYSNTQLLVG